MERAGEIPSTEWENVCAFCDDGGYLICCDGGCLRSFHRTKEHGKASGCTSLDLTEEYQWNAENYTCENCRRKQHQCFACGLLGSSDSSSSVPKVFQCKDQNCGHFYHPKCVADLLYPDSETMAIDFQLNVADGLQFRCPMHRCRACNGAENKDDKKLQFALCRRCPTAYHRMCLPSEIGFKASKREGTPQRAWDDVLTDRVLIYCTKHGIDRELSTPKRDHIVFPPDEIDLLSLEGSESIVKDDEQEEEEEELDKSPQLSTETGRHDRRRPKPIDSVSAKQPGSRGDRILRKQAVKRKLSAEEPEDTSPRNN